MTYDSREIKKTAFATFVDGEIDKLVLQKNDDGLIEVDLGGLAQGGDVDLLTDRMNLVEAGLDVASVGATWVSGLAYTTRKSADQEFANAAGVDAIRDVIIGGYEDELTTSVDNAVRVTGSSAAVSLVSGQILGAKATRLTKTGAGTGQAIFQKQLAGANVSPLRTYEFKPAAAGFAFRVVSGRSNITSVTLELYMNATRKWSR